MNEHIFQQVIRHAHTGVDSPQVEVRNLSGVHDYRVTYGTATVSNGTSNVQEFSTGVARFGDYVLLGAPYSHARVIVTGYVSGSGTTTILAQNESGGSVTLNRGTWNIRILKS